MENKKEVQTKRAKCLEGDGSFLIRKRYYRPVTGMFFLFSLSCKLPLVPRVLSPRCGGKSFYRNFTARPRYKYIYGTYFRFNFGIAGVCESLKVEN